MSKATTFYCDELGLFELGQDFGMGQISLEGKENKNIRLLLQEGMPQAMGLLFHLAVNDCDAVFERLKRVPFKTGALLLNEEIFEYPLGKNVTLKDPAGNMFLLYEDYSQR